MTIEEENRIRNGESITISDGVAEIGDVIMDKQKVLNKGWSRRHHEDSDLDDEPSDYCKYTSTGEDYEIDSDGCEYKPSWIK